MLTLEGATDEHAGDQQAIDLVRPLEDALTVLLHSLEDAGGPHAAPHAHSHHAVTDVAPVHL